MIRELTIALTATTLCFVTGCRMPTAKDAQAALTTAQALCLATHDTLDAPELQKLCQITDDLAPFLTQLVSAQRDRRVAARRELCQ